MERIRPALKCHRPDQASDPEKVIGVEVRQKQISHPEARSVAHHLPLRTLAAVEQKKITLSLNRDRAHVTANRRAGCRGAQERDSDHGIVSLCPVGEANEGGSPREGSSRYRWSEEAYLNSNGSSRLRQSTLIEDGSVRNVRHRN